MDSLNGNHPRALSRLNEYLQEEAKDKKGIANPSPAKTRKATMPIQPNHCDCGLYLLHFAQSFVADPEKYIAAIFVSISPTYFTDKYAKTIACSRARDRPTRIAKSSGTSTG